MNRPQNEIVCRYYHMRGMSIEEGKILVLWRDLVGPPCCVPEKYIFITESHMDKLSLILFLLNSILSNLMNML